MKLKHVALLACLLLAPWLCSCSPDADAWMSPVMIGGGVEAAGGATWLLEENFEGSNACGDGSHTNCDENGIWNVVGDGTIDFNDASDPPQGSYGLLIDSGSTYDWVYSDDWSGITDPTYGFFEAKLVQVIASGEILWFRLYSSDAGSIVAEIKQRESGGVNYLGAWAGSVFGGGWSGALTEGNTICVWWEFDDANNDFHVWIDYDESDGCTKPGAVTIESTSGDQAASAARVYFYSNAGDEDTIFDRILVDDENTYLGSDP